MISSTNTRQHPPKPFAYLSSSYSLSSPKTNQTLIEGIATQSRLNTRSHWNEGGNQVENQSTALHGPFRVGIDIYVKCASAAASKVICHSQTCLILSCLVIFSVTIPTTLPITIQPPWTEGRRTPSISRPSFKSHTYISMAPRPSSNCSVVDPQLELATMRRDRREHSVAVVQPIHVRNA
jgi:hypothetical protein